MPPCGYRSVAVESIRRFLIDNLEYFIELYTRRDISISEALESEAMEIDRIRRGERGGTWSKLVVELNSRFYAQLRAERPSSWEDVRRLGNGIADAAVHELSSLSVEIES